MPQVPDDERREGRCIVAAPFALNCKYADDIGEYMIRYDPDRNSFEKLLDFAEFAEGKRLTVSFAKSVDFSVMRSVCKVHTGGTFCRMTRSQLRESAGELAESRVPFFLDEPVGNAVVFQNLLALGACAIYPAGDLLYHLPQVRQQAEVRIVLNHLADAEVESQPECGMFWSPQAYNVYSRWMDVVEFDCGEPYNWDRFGVFHRSWIERHVWRGNLQEVIGDLPIAVPGNSYDQGSFIRYKVECGRKCAYDRTCRCRKCQLMLDLAYIMSRKHIGVRPAPGE